jgi:Subtilisin inhibitor-like
VRTLLSALAALALLTACGSDDPGADADPSGADGGAAGISQTQNDLAIEADAGDGSAPVSWTLVCAGEAEGTHPDPEAACAHLETLEDPFAPLPDDVVCTEQFGGPQTAHVAGVWGGEPVDVQLSRVDGCRIGQWDELGPLLPIDVG